MLIADDVVGGEREALATVQLHFVSDEVADAHLRSGEIGHDSQTPAGRSRRGAQSLDHLLVTAEISVRKVEAGDVHPGSEHRFHYLL